MTLFTRLFLGLFFMAFAWAVFAMHCPDPQTTSLRFGIPPKPWVKNPFSPRNIPADPTSSFVRANLLVVHYGQGVLCMYQSTVGDFSIWWRTLVRTPVLTDEAWIKAPGGFLCTRGLKECQFYPAV